MVRRNPWAMACLRHGHVIWDSYSIHVKLWQTKNKAFLNDLLTLKEEISFLKDYRQAIALGFLSTIAVVEFSTLLWF